MLVSLASPVLNDKGVVQPPGYAGAVHMSKLGHSMCDNCLNLLRRGRVTSAHVYRTRRCTKMALSVATAARHTKKSHHSLIY